MTERLIQSGKQEITKILAEIGQMLRTGYKDSYLIRYNDGSVKVLTE
jgi:hypothetical protein